MIKFGIGGLLALRCFAPGCLVLGGPAQAVETAYIGATSPGVVNVLDTRTNTVVARIPVGLQNGNEAIAATVSKDGTRAYAVSNTLKTLSVIDTAANVVTAVVPLAARPHDAIVSPDGSKVYVTSEDGTLVTVSTATNTVSNTLQLTTGVWSMAITPDGSKLYVANPQLNTLTVVNTATGLPGTPLSMEPNPFSMDVSPDGSKLYVASAQARLLTVVNTATNAMTFFSTSALPGGVRVSPDGTKLFVTATTPATPQAAARSDLEVRNAATGIVLQSYQVGLGAQGVNTTADGGKALVINQGVGNLSAIDLVAQQYLATTVIGPNESAFNRFIANAPAPKLLAATLPQVRSTVNGGSVSAFATIINPGATALTNCRPAVNVIEFFGKVTLTYQTTNAQNQLTGTPDTPVSIPANGQQSFVFTLTEDPQNGFSGQPDLFFTCDGLRAPVYPAVGDFRINLDQTAGPDVIPVAVTPSQDGVIRIATHNGSQAMATAAVNIGPSRLMTVKPVIVAGGSAVPVNLSVYETDVNGQPLGQPAASVTVQLATNTPRYFGVIATATGTIPLQADAVRVVLQFTDSIGTLRGQTSVAIVAP